MHKVDDAVERGREDYVTGTINFGQMNLRRIQTTCHSHININL